MAADLSAAPLLALQTPPKPSIQRKRGPPTALTIETPAPIQPIVVNLPDSTVTSLSSAASDAPSDFMRFDRPAPAKSRSLRNMKQLSLALPSAASSTHSLSIPPPDQTAVASSSRITSDAASVRSRSTSVSSLSVNTALGALALRKHEDSEGTTGVDPYADGPIEILPGIWLGNEDNARDTYTLAQFGIKAILNVAQEVTGIEDVAAEHGLDFLKLNWSHGQKDLGTVKDGFPAGFAFVDAARQRGDGVLVHCQCGISRSGTMVIALVMRAAAEGGSDVPQEVQDLKTFDLAYKYVKSKSAVVGPNMHLVIELSAYEKHLNGGPTSPADSDRSSSIAEEEAEWIRRRQALEDEPEEEQEIPMAALEAQALDQAMVDRLEKRRGSLASNTSSLSGPMSAGPVLGGVPAFKKRFGAGRKRHSSKASMSSIRSTSSIISEHLVEEDEEAEVLGLGSAYDTGSRSPSVIDSPVDMPSDFISPRTARPGRQFVPLSAAPTKTSFGLPSAPAHKTQFLLPPPKTAMRASFDLDSTPRPKHRRRPAPLVDVLPPVPSSPDLSQDIVVESSVASTTTPVKLAVPPIRRIRTTSKQPTPPPLFLRTHSQQSHSLPSAGPSQTLFVFPPSPSNTPMTSRTPSTMTLMSNLQQIPFPTVTTPRVATEKRHGRTRSFVALGVPPTPTTACSRVDARGWFGQDA